MGKVFSNRLDTTFILVRRGFGVNGGYEIECGWEVEEAHDDDYGSYSYHPFRTTTPRPWVGQKKTVATVAEAAALYDEWKVALNGYARPVGGTVIGSVRRGHHA